MTRFTLPITSLATLLVCAFSTVPSHAQSRVFVAAKGSDSNPCTFPLPCRTFQHAHDVVAPNGEIDVLDPAGYGAVTIIKSISIQGHGFAGISAPSNFAITVNAGPSDAVSLRGLLIDGLSTGSEGIAFNSGAVLRVQDSVIRGFRDGGIVLNQAPARVYLSSTLIADSGTGVAAQPRADGLFVSLSRMELSGNGRGVDAFGAALPLHKALYVSVSDSVIMGSSQEGILCTTSLFVSSSVTVVVTRSSIVDGAGTGLRAIGAGALIELNATTVANNATGWSTTDGGAMSSWGNNSFSDAGSNGDGVLPLRSPI